MRGLEGADTNTWSGTAVPVAQGHDLALASDAVNTQADKVNIMAKPEFLNGSGGGGESAPQDAFPNPAQKSGAITPDGEIENFENRPQKSGESQGNPKSIPAGGKLPYSGPAKQPSLPAKLRG